MSLDRSLKGKGGLVRHRNVLKRAERLTILKDDERWDESKSVFGLPKVAVRKVVKKKAAAEKKEEVVAGAEAGVEGAAAPAAAGAAAAPAKGAPAKGHRPRAGLHPPRAHRPRRRPSPARGQRPRQPSRQGRQVGESAGRRAAPRVAHCGPRLVLVIAVWLRSAEHRNLSGSAWRLRDADPCICTIMARQSFLAGGGSAAGGRCRYD